MPLTKENNNSIKAFGRLIQIMQTDEFINKKVTEALKLDAYRRCQVLNKWLEHLRIQKAPQNLLNALSCLFDDKIAKQVLKFISKHN